MITIEIFKLFGSILVDSSKAEESISKTDEKAKGLGERLGQGIKTAAKWGAGLVAGAGAAVTGMIALANKTAEAADFIDKLSERTGINREELQRWKYAADQSGADIGKLEVGMKKLSDTMDKANTGSKLSVEAFERLGISMEEVQSKSPSEMFETVAKKLADMPDSAERNALGNQLLGKSYTELMPLLNAGSEGMTDLMNRADELGLVMSEDAVKANVVFGDTMADLKSSFGAIFMHLSNQFLPVLQVFINFILEHMPQIQSVIGTVFGFISEVAKVAIDAIQNVLGAFNNFFNGSTEGSEIFKQYFEAFKTWFMDLFNLLVELVKASLEAIKAFWDKHGEAITKVAKSIWDIIKVVIDTSMKVIKDVIKVITAIIKGDWEGAWEGIKNIFVNIWEGMKKLLPKLLEGLLNIMKLSFNLFKDIGKNLFNMIWEGMKSIWTSISNWVSDKVSWLVDKLAFWKKGNDEMEPSNSTSSRKKVDGSHASGLAYVPFDGYRAELHKGEGILTAEENKARHGMSNSSDAQEIIINNYTTLDGKVVAKSTSRIQSRKNNSKARALGALA